MTKISDLSAMLATDVDSANDLVTVVDMSATGASRNKKMTFAELAKALTGGMLEFKGATDASANPNYPAADKGDFYVVSVAGKIGGASGTAVDVGDVYFATADNAGGTQAAVGSSWSALEHDGAFGTGGGDLLSTNNLSDLANPAAARGNLGLHAVTTQTGTSYTAVLADADSMVRFTNGSAVTFTIPPNSSVAFPVGSFIEIVQAGAGAVSVAAGSGVTINSRSSDLTLAGQYAVAFVKKVATDTWIMNGDL